VVVTCGPQVNGPAEGTPLDEPAQPRDRAYLDLLHHGLVLLRSAANGGQVQLCRIEAEHLHEVPTLIGEANEHRHLYYLRGTRGLYLQQLRELEASDYLEQVAIWYSQAWQVLAGAAGVPLPG